MSEAKGVKNILTDKNKEGYIHLLSFEKELDLILEKILPEESEEHENENEHQEKLRQILDLAEDEEIEEEEERIIIPSPKKSKDSLSLDERKPPEIKTKEKEKSPSHIVLTATKWEGFFVEPRELQNVDEVLKNLIMGISEEFGKKGNCVANSYYMAKLLLEPANQSTQLKNSLYNVTDHEGLALNSNYEYFRKLLRDADKRESKKVSKIKNQNCDSTGNIVNVRYNTKKCEDISSITSLVQDIHDTLSNGPANGIFVAATEDHNYLYVVNQKKEVFVVDSDLGLFFQLNKQTIPIVANIYGWGLFVDPELQQLDLTYVGNLHSSWGSLQAAHKTPENIMFAHEQLTNGVRGDVLNNIKPVILGSISTSDMSSGQKQTPMPWE